MADTPTPPLPVKSAPARPKPVRRPIVKPRAPFLPQDHHPHGWVAKRQLKPHQVKPS